MLRIPCKNPADSCAVMFLVGTAGMLCIPCKNPADSCAVMFLVGTAGMLCIPCKNPADSCAVMFLVGTAGFEPKDMSDGGIEHVEHFESESRDPMHAWMGRDVEAREGLESLGETRQR
jgi:hypothetical protein